MRMREARVLLGKIRSFAQSLTTDEWEAVEGQLGEMISYVMEDSPIDGMSREEFADYMGIRKR